MKVLTRYTIRSLFKEKNKTIVTICGIILSTALITGVLSLTHTLKYYSIDYAIKGFGNYEAYIQDIDELKEEDIDEISIVNNIGYVKDDNITNQYKPYLFVISAEDNLYDMTALKLIEGRWPRSDDEIVLPLNLINSTEHEYKIGDELILDVGKRYANNEYLSQNAPYDHFNGETIVENDIYKFKVVGIYKRPTFEEYFAPIYTCITTGLQSDLKDAFVTFKNIKDVESYVNDVYGDHEVALNYSLLDLKHIDYNELDDNTIMFIALIIFLMFIIVFASILLIHNVFAITISHRSRQYGLLGSIGATKKQISYSLFVETLCLSLVGIPLGIFFGLISLEITLVLTTDLFKILVYGSDYIVDKLHVVYNFKLLASIFLISLCIVVFSSYFAYHKSIKLPIIDALRRTSELDVDVKKFKVNNFLKKHLSIEALLALKSFKLAKRSYIAIIFSIILSIVLFLSASTFISYITKVNELTASYYSYDLVYYNSDYKDYKKLYDELRGISSVEKSSIIYYNFDTCVVGDISNNAAYLNLSSENEMSCINAYIDDESYDELVKINNHDGNGYMYYDYCNAYIFEDETYLAYNIFEQEVNDIYVKKYKNFDGYDLYSENEDSFSFYNEQLDKYMDIPKDEAFDYELNHLTNRIEIPPLGIDANSNILVIVKRLSDVSNVDPFNIQFFFKTKDHAAVYEKMVEVLDKYHLYESYIYDFGGNLDINDSTRNIIQIFSYGFVFIILLIGMLNISNTVNTNMHLKKRSIAILKSIGISKKSLYKEMIYESLIYGLIAIIGGLVLSIMASYVIYVVYLEKFGFAFYMPIDSIIYIILIVLAVIVVSLIYSIKKVKSSNIIEEITIDIM